MPTASIDVTVEFSTPVPGPNDPVPRGSPAKAGESVDVGAGVSMTGSASKAGASTDKTVPAPGGSDQTQQSQDIPKVGTFVRAEITARLTGCPDGVARVLTLRGDVSVSARLDGNCIELIAVSETRDNATGKTSTKTRKRKICCNDATVPASDQD